MEARIASCAAFGAVVPCSSPCNQARNASSSCGSPLLSICSGGNRVSFSSVGWRGSQRWMLGAVYAAGGGKDVYQPFRPPPSIVKMPAPGTSSPEEQLEILRERRGLWHEYALVVPYLTRAGYTPAEIEEATGMTGVEQNMIVVASQVRLSLMEGGTDEEVLAFFDVGGAELLYELRILSTFQRQASAEYIASRKMEPKEAKELARAVKDYERRRKEEGWDFFTSSPGDCLAFACYRQGKEVRSEAEKESLINKGLGYAVTENARIKLRKALGVEDLSDSSEQVQAVKAQLQVVRLSSQQDTAHSPLPVILPVANDLTSVDEAPLVGAVGAGVFNIYNAQPPWKSWLALPGWPSIVKARAPLAVLFPDARILLQSSSQVKEVRNEPLLLVVDKGIVSLEEECHFLVEEEQRLVVHLASSRSILAKRKVFGKILVALRPPLPENEAAESWE